MFYILGENHEIIEAGVVEGAMFFEDIDKRRVALTQVGDNEVSTVFLGVDHNFSGQGPPVLFETMVFDKDGKDIDCRRYCTWDEAEKGHWEIVEALKAPENSAQKE